MLVSDRVHSLMYVIAYLRRPRPLNGPYAPNTFVSNTARTSSRGRDACTALLPDLLEGRARLSRMRDGRVVHQDVETAELTSDALCRGGNEDLIGDVDLESPGIRSYAPCGRLPMLEVARAEYLLLKRWLQSPRYVAKATEGGTWQEDVAALRLRGV